MASGNLTKALLVAVRAPDASEFPRLRELYVDWGYDGGMGEADRVFAAELGDHVVGLVRLTDEDGTLMLRGCFVDPARRGQGIGRQLLKAFLIALQERECYCVPFRHLTEFYGSAGFVEVPERSAPAFLQGRAETYRQQGHDVVIMYRRGHGDGPARLAV